MMYCMNMSSKEFAEVVTLLINKEISFESAKHIVKELMIK